MPRQLMKTSQWHTRWAEGLCARCEMHREDVTAGRLREGARLLTPGQRGAGTGLPMPSRERARCCSCEQHVLRRPQPEPQATGAGGCRAGDLVPSLCGPRDRRLHRGDGWEPVRTRQVRRDRVRTRGLVVRPLCAFHPTAQAALGATESAPRFL